MNLQECTSLVYRIVQGKTNIRILGQDYIIYAPSLIVLSSSQQLYNEIIDEYKYEPWLRENECERVLIYNGLWGKDKEEKLTQLNKIVDKQKIDIYKSFFDFKKRLQLKQGLTYLREEIERLEETKHSLDYLTLGGFANIIQAQFIISKIVHNKNEELIFSDCMTSNFSLLHLFQSRINGLVITPDEYKEVARNEPWSSYWRASKTDVFPNKGVQLTGEQRNLILFSQMYDNVNEHPESPHQDIINDNDALDGWLLVQRIENDKKKGEQTVKNTTGGIPDSAQEVFLPAKSREDIERIEGLNSLESKMIKAQRKAVIQQAGVIEDSKLPDQQVVIRKLAMDQFKKGK